MDKEIREKAHNKVYAIYLNLMRESLQPDKYWKIEINQFQEWMLSFNKFVGEWQTTEIEKDKILIEYTYTLYSNNVLLYPFNWIFTKRIF